MKHETYPPPYPGRRRFLQIVAATGAVGAFWHIGLNRFGSRQHTVRQSRVMMGTQINLTIHGPDREQCDDAIESTFARMNDIIHKLSRHEQGSELSTLNSTGFLKNPSKDLHQVLLLAEHISTLTDGGFDVTVLPLQKLFDRHKAQGTLPSQKEYREALQLIGYRKLNNHPNKLQLAKRGMGITLDGIGKGYIVDKGTDILRSKGFDSVYVEAGGDLMVSGNKPDNAPWRIGIRNPRPHGKNGLLSFEVVNRAVATSGDYMQPYTPDLKYHHIIDPRTGFSPPELASATVTAPTVALADGLATAAMVLGPKKAIAIFNSLPDCEGLFIGKDLEQYRTTGFIS